MFGHPGISALEYAGTIEPPRKKSTSVTLSLKRKPTGSVHNENTTSPTTAPTAPLDLGKAEPEQVIDEFGSPQRRRGTFFNHTPRDFEIRTATQRVEVYRPSRPDNANFSCLRPSLQIDSNDIHHVSTDQHEYDSPGHSEAMEKRITVNRGAPVELDSREVVLNTAPEVYVPSAEFHRRSMSMPMARVITYQPKSADATDRTGREASIGSAGTLENNESKEKQRCQTPYQISTPKSTNVACSASLEPSVALHGPEAANNKDESTCSQAEESDGEAATFQVIHRYFESQAKSLSRRSSIKCYTQPPDPLCIQLSAPSEPAAPKTISETVPFPSMMELETSSEPPPAVPDRSPERLKNPSFSLHATSVATTESEFAYAAEDQHSAYDKRSDLLHIHKKRTQRRISVGQAAPVGSPNLGRMAPPILGHAALTACSDLGLNDISFYLRNTGPTMDTQITSRQRKRPGIRMFRVKSKKSLAARVGSVEGSPQRARKPIPVPACAREMTTSSGARHLKIVIPSDTPSSNRTLSLPGTMTKPQYSSIHASAPFTEDRVRPLTGTEAKRTMTAAAYEGSTSAPVTSYSASVSSERGLVRNLSLASREEQTRARKLRDLHKAKGKPTPSEMQHDGSPTPAQIGEQSEFREEVSQGKITRLEERVNNLEELNAELMRTLARLIVGVEVEEGKMRREDVLRAWRLVGYEGVLRGIGGGVGEEELVAVESAAVESEGHGQEEGQGGEERLGPDVEGGAESEIM